MNPIFLIQCEMGSQEIFLTRALLAMGRLSKAECHRSLQTGAVKVNHEIVMDPSFKLQKGNTYSIQIGKKNPQKATLVVE